MVDRTVTDYAIAYDNVQYAVDPGDAMVSIAWAQTYVTNNVLHHSSWDSSTLSQRTIALKEASNRLNQLNYRGQRLTAAQSYAFPRYPDVSVPTPIMQATVELALALLDGVDPESEYKELAVTSRSYSGIRYTRESSSALLHVAAGIPCIRAWHLIQPYLEDVGAIWIDRTG